MTSNILDIENLIKGFELSCRTENKSPKTTEWYKSFLERFSKFLIIRGLPTGIGEISTTHIRHFIRYLQTEAKVPKSTKPLSAATVQGYTRTLKAFFSWLMREDYCQFLNLYGKQGRRNSVVFAKNIDGIDLYFAWVIGNKKYLEK